MAPIAIHILDSLFTEPYKAGYGYLNGLKYPFSHPLGWEQIPGPWLLVTALHTTNSLWADTSLRQTTEASPSGVDHLNVSWHGMIFSYNHCAQPSIRAQLKTSWNIASNVTKMADAGILLAMVVGILCKKSRKRWMEKVSYGNIEMVTKTMGKRYIQTVYSSLTMKSEPKSHSNNYLCLLAHINFKN